MYVHSAVDWESFTIDDDHFLLVSNAQNGGPEQEHYSVMYRWQGLDKFVKVHTMATEANSDWEVFEFDGNTYFISTNAKGRNSQVFKSKLKF